MKAMKFLTIVLFSVGIIFNASAAIELKPNTVITEVKVMEIINQARSGMSGKKAPKLTFYLMQATLINEYAKYRFIEGDPGVSAAYLAKLSRGFHFLYQTGNIIEKSEKNKQTKSEIYKKNVTQFNIAVKQVNALLARVVYATPEAIQANQQAKIEYFTPTEAK